MTSRQKSPQTNHPLTRAEFLRLPAWQREHATRLHRQFKRVELAQQNGKSVNAALRKFGYYWQDETFRSDPSRRVRVSISTLRRLFYRWLKFGRTPRSIALRYNPRRSPKPTRLHLARYLKAVTDPRVMTMHGAFIQANGLPFKWGFFWRSLPNELRAPLRRLLFARRGQRSEERRFARFVRDWRKSGGHS